MSCDEVRELLAGYALDALDAGELAAVGVHLANCREHDRELAELRAACLALGTLQEAPEPSAALGARIAWITRPVEPVSLRRPRVGSGLRWGMATAAALLLVAVFAAGWLGGGRWTPASPVTRYSYQMRGTAGELIQFAGVEGTDRVTVTMAGIAPLPAGRNYQLWAIRDGRWLSIGVCNTDDYSWWVGDFPFALREGEEVAVTVEPAGGSATPSGDPLLRTRF